MSQGILASHGRVGVSWLDSPPSAKGLAPGEPRLQLGTLNLPLLRGFSRGEEGVNTHACLYFRWILTGFLLSGQLPVFTELVRTCTFGPITPLSNLVEIGQRFTNLR